MNGIPQLEKEILVLITKNFPYTYSDVEFIYLTLGSIDKTISFLKVWLTLPRQGSNLLNFLSNEIEEKGIQKQSLQDTIPIAHFENQYLGNWKYEDFEPSKYIGKPKRNYKK